MKIANFHADADLVGRRIRVSWEFLLEGANLAAIPAVQVRRKTRDFEFPSASGEDRFLVYDSAAFPPAATTLSDLPGREVRDGDNRTVYFAESAARIIDVRKISQNCAHRGRRRQEFQSGFGRNAESAFRTDK